MAGCQARLRSVGVEQLGSCICVRRILVVRGSTLRSYSADVHGRTRPGPGSLDDWHDAQRNAWEREARLAGMVGMGVHGRLLVLEHLVR